MQLLGFLFVVCFFLHVSARTFYSANYDKTTGLWSVAVGTGGVAVGFYDVSQNSTGWNVLNITTDGKQSDALQAYGAGYLEAYLTYNDIWLAWLTFNATNSYSDEVASFVLAQDKWVRTMVTEQSPSSEYWTQIGLTLKQFDGLVAGYTKFAPKNTQLTYLQMLYAQLEPELGDINTYVQLVHDEYFEPEYTIGSHCSVLIRLSSDGKHLFTAHDTWTSFNTMLRVYKTYNLNFGLVSNKAPSVTFSSYPNNIQSTDDFYITSANLVVMETTNDVFNNSLFLNNFSPNTVPEWIRIIIANRMSSTGKEWVNFFEIYNSGTYNNQWQIVDYKLFTPGSPLKPGTLWIAEQIPGYVVSDDLTEFLSKNRFWPSYNIPYFPEIYNISNYPAYFQKYGNTYSYSLCARAQIFRRDAPKVETLADMRKIMRYNEYQTDPLSLHDACRSISARCDLNAPWTLDTLNQYSAFGAIDAKITDNTMVSKLEAWAVAGPTWDSQPPFAWTHQWDGVPHYGEPLVYAFDFLVMPPPID